MFTQFASGLFKVFTAFSKLLAIVGHLEAFFEFFDACGEG